MHHAVAAHDGEHIDAIGNRLMGHRLRFGEVTTQQDLQVGATIA